MAGPIVGQIFYSKFGFVGCFYSTTVLLALTAFMSWKYIPDQVNQGKLASISAVHSAGDDNEDLDAT
jgi:hypothetical protein